MDARDELRTARATGSGPPERSAPELSIIIPTFNEQENIVALHRAIQAALGDTAFELVFVDDDSTDRSREEIRALARHDLTVRLVHRIGRRGLATAVTEGMLSTTAPYLAVIDADLQHDERVLPDMLAVLKRGDADLVIGSRYMAGGGMGDWGKGRVRVSAFATRLAQLVTRTKVSDPMSGFFAITRPAFENAVRDLSGQGYKILLDICASARQPMRIVEVPYEFRSRVAGESKLDSLIVWEYFLLLVDKTIGHIVPARFVSFMMIGAFGIFVHMAILYGLVEYRALRFIWAQTAASVITMIFNFFVNNMLTYRDRRLKGFWAMTRGLASFVAVCSFGAIANIGIANFLFQDRYVWWVAGLAGIAMGAVWNYAATSLFTWRQR